MYKSIFWAFLIFSCCKSTVIWSQISQNEYSSLLDWHDKQIGIYSLGILNGPVYVFKKTSPKTHQFFNSPGWQAGTVTVSGQSYHNLLLVYDMSIDALILKHPDPGYPHGVELRNIEAFHLYDHHFVWLKNSAIPEGFYDELFKGNEFGLYTKRIKKERAGDPEGTEYRELGFYYIQYHKNLYPFHNMKSIFALNPEKKNLIRKLKKTSNLRPTVKRESDLISFIQVLEENLNQ